MSHGASTPTVDQGDPGATAWPVTEAALNTAIGAQADAAAGTDTGTFSLIAFIKRLMQKLTTQLPAALAAGGGLKIEGVAGGVAVPVSDSNQVPLTGTWTQSTVDSLATSQTIKASNANRKGFSVYNTDANTLYLSLTTPATQANSFVAIAKDAYYEMPYPLNTGTIYGIWGANGAGQARIVEMT